MRPAAEQRERAAALAAARRARLREQRAQLRELTRIVAGMTPEQRAEVGDVYVVGMAGHKLSVFNACLVRLQLPGAWQVGGRQQWGCAGRLVLRGERGIAIWVPVGQPNDDAPAAADDDSAAYCPELAADGHPIGCRVGYVYDVTQTDDFWKCRAWDGRQIIPWPPRRRRWA